MDYTLDMPSASVVFCPGTGCLPARRANPDSSVFRDPGPEGTVAGRRLSKRAVK